MTCWNLLRRRHRRKSSRVGKNALALEHIEGRVGSDGVEKISSEMVFEWLGVEPFARSAVGERLRGLMVRRGWVPVRARHATSKGHAARVRGYARLAEQGYGVPLSTK